MRCMEVKEEMEVNEGRLRYMKVCQVLRSVKVSEGR